MTFLETYQFTKSSKPNLPTCINHGCNRHVARNGKKLRPVCWRCQRASYGAMTLSEGVTPFKTGKCSNHNGRLGFECPIDYNKPGAEWVFGQTEIDHIDGNDRNNTLENVQELCKPCHAYKGKLNGDQRQRHNRENDNA